MSTLRGLLVARAEVHVPPSGAWRAWVTLPSGDVPAPGPALLQVADLALRGTVLAGRGGLDGPDQPGVVVAGGAGWEALLSRPGVYSSASGVRLSTVLRDVASLAVEPYVEPDERLLGTRYEWTAALPGRHRPVRSVLADLIERGAIPTWRVPPDGAARFDVWPAIGAADRFAGAVISRDLVRGVRYVGLTDRAAAFLPGATLEGATIQRVIFTDVSEELSAEVWSR